MLTPDQRRVRCTGLTATDTVILAGEGYRNASVLDIYNEKIHGPVEFPQSVAMRIGEHNEALAMTLLAEEYGLVLSDGVTERHPIIDYELATPDRNVLEKPGGTRVAVAEAKYVGLGKAGLWNGDCPPDAVVIQLTKQLIVTRLRRGYVSALIGTEPRFFELELDEDLAAALLELDERFWKDHVVARVPPDPEATLGAARALRDLYPRVKGGMMLATAEVEELAREYFAAKRELDELEARALAAENGLKAAIREAKGIVGDGWQCSWNERRGSVAYKRAVEALAPGVAAHVLEQFRGEKTRVFECKAAAPRPALGSST